MNTKYIILVVIFLTSTTNILAQNITSLSRWQTKNIVIDGKNNEWKKPFNFYEKKSGFLYSITNDSTNLYLCFSINDNIKLKKILKAGWNIKISHKGKKDKFKVSINFPTLLSDVNLDSKNNNKSSYPILANLFQFQLKQIISTGFLNNKNEIPYLKIKGNKIDVGVNKLNNFIYEIAIPLKNIFTKNKISLNEILKLEVIINDLKNISRKNVLYYSESEKKAIKQQYQKREQNRKTNNNNNNNNYIENEKILLYKTSFKLKFQLNNN